jgi:hypothetical protein
VSATSDDFLSGTSGQVWGVRATTRATVADALANAGAIARARPWRLPRAAARWPRRRVLALGIDRTDVPNLLARTRSQLLESRHDVRFASTAAGSRGRFENFNALLADNPPDPFDWLVLVDDDVALPDGFLDSFLFLAERFQLRLAQPAHQQRSHAGWQVTRRRPASVVRETSFVEIGPLVAFAHVTFDALLPFPPLRFGWGLDAHWGAIAQQRGWRIGIVDATPIRHHMRRTASSYSSQDAVDEARRFLADRPYVSAADAQRTLVTHRSWG